MGNDVSIGKVAISTQLLLHRGEERQVDIQLLVARTIERTHSGRTLSAGGLSAVGIEHHRGHLILHIILCEDVCPYILSTSQDLSGKGSQLLFFLCKLTLFAADLRILAIRLLGSLYASLQRIAASKIGNSHCDNDTTDTQSGLLTTAHSATVFHIRAFASSI